MGHNIFPASVLKVLIAKCKRSSLNKRKCFYNDLCLDRNKI